MTIKELAAYIESRFKCIDGLPLAYCQTGEPYVMLADGSAAASHSKSEAIRNARLAFDDYAAGKQGTLYWRSRPTHLVADVPGQRRNRIWYLPLRLVISERAVKFTTLEEAIAV